MNISLRQFLLRFTALFLAGYGFNIAFIGVTHSGGIYIHWIAEQFNYIRTWQTGLLKSTAFILELFHYPAEIRATTLFVSGKAAIILSYSCIGYGVASFFAAFVLSWPCGLLKKIKILLPGIFALQCLNVCRLTVLSIAPWLRITDPHLVYNLLIYSLVIYILYRWTEKSDANGTIG